MRLICAIETDNSSEPYAIFEAKSELLIWDVNGEKGQNFIDPLRPWMGAMNPGDEYILAVKFRRAGSAEMYTITPKEFYAFSDDIRFVDLKATEVQRRTSGRRAAAME